MESRQKRSKAKRSLGRSFVVTMAVGIPTGLAAGGCSSTPDSNATPNGTSPLGPGVQSGKCTDEGAQAPCHFALGTSSNGKILSCFAGTQTCTGGIWSACGGDGTVRNSALDPSVSPAGIQGGGLHALAIGDNVSCNDGICSPKKCMGGGSNNKECASSADCAGAKPCVAAETCSNCPGDCGICPPGAPTGAVAVCTSDPCNPDCQGWINNAGVSSASGVGATTIGVNGFGEINNGMQQKLLLDQLRTGTRCDNFGAVSLPSSYYNCQIDTYCQLTAMGGDGNCHQFPPAAIQGTDTKGLGSNPGMDVTIGPGCADKESDGYRFFPICNRGTTPILAGTIIRVKYYNPNQAFSPCPIAAGYDCSMLVGDLTLKNGYATPGDLLPGTCQLLDTEQAGMGPGPSNCTQPSGNKWIFVNSDGAVPEGNITMTPGIPPAGVTGAPVNEPTTVPGISGCANNWTDHSGSNNPPSCGVAGQNVVKVSSDYHATCPPGYGVLWSRLTYSAISQSNGSGTSEIFFEAATAKDVAGVAGPYSSFIELAEATDNAFVGRKDPSVCTTTQPAGPAAYAWTGCTNATIGPNPNCCPKDIEDQFKRAITNLPFAGADPGPGAILARQEWLRLQITIKATPDNKKDATLTNWSISYQCVPQE